MKYVVAPKRSLVTQVKGINRHLRPGQEVPADSKSLGEWVASGFVLALGEPGTPGEAVPSPLPVSASLWNLDPTPLRKKTLDQLNIMIRERDPSAVLAATKDEAVNKLSGKA